MNNKMILAKSEPVFDIFLSLIDKINSIMKKTAKHPYYISGLTALAFHPNAVPMTVDCELTENILNKKQQVIWNDFLETEMGKYYNEGVFIIDGNNFFQWYKEGKKACNTIEFIRGTGIKMYTASTVGGNQNELLLPCQVTDVTDTINELYGVLYDNELGIVIQDYELAEKFINYKGIMDLYLDFENSEIYISPADEELLNYLEENEVTFVKISNKFITGMSNLLNTKSKTLSGTIEFTLSSMLISRLTNREVNAQELSITYNLTDAKSGLLKRTTTNHYLITSTSKS